MSEYIVSYETLQHLPFAINLMGKEVVRCKDCCYFRVCCGLCDYHYQQYKTVSPDHFCAYGRKERP